MFLNIHQHKQTISAFAFWKRDYTKKPSVLFEFWERLYKKAISAFTQTTKRERERDMGLLELATGFNIAVLLVFFLFLVTLRVLFSCWISPTLKYWKIRRNGFGGPTPSFPLGNIKDIVKMSGDSSLQSSNSPHDIHSNVFPYFAQWQKSHGELLAS